MQQPTCRNTRIRNVHDAQVILHAVWLKRLPMLHRRLDDEERQALAPGDIYVWEERSNNPMDAPSLEAMQRFTDGRSWGPSKARDDFLVYREKDVPSRSSLMTRNNGLQSMQLIKQTYSAFVDGPANTRKWHLNAYYTQETANSFKTIDDIPELRAIPVPRDKYHCARTSALRKAQRAARPSPSAEEGAAVHLSATYVDVSPSPTSPYLGKRGSATASPGYSADGRFELSLECRLAPLEYLQSLSPGTRDPVDEQVLRSFRR
ncbi:Gti1/Pac2 family-domain-containing protein [Phanerochaete sordida]|uniref:Gti1/Pac2 family-domain-containing protein n=1 Tax=Phanerochaete sordida TaxID=48140 RepID=A0A9P3GB18_9APHY|nr:Gti1/Pac2 family-domain-containing protein [Phanerochaete sordida]